MITNLIFPATDAQRQEAINGGNKQMGELPNWKRLAKLPQMVVEINFENDSVAIQPASYRTLGMIADALHHPNMWAYNFLIVGHASSTGDEKHNLDLSERLQILRDRMGLWHEYAPLISSLSRDGFNPSSI